MATPKRSRRALSRARQGPFRPEGQALSVQILHWPEASVIEVCERFLIVTHRCVTLNHWYRFCRNDKYFKKSKEDVTMKQRIVQGVIVGTMCCMMVFPSVVLAGQGRGTGKGPAFGNEPRKAEHIREQRRFEHGKQIREPGNQSVNRRAKGYSYGPGDGTGYDGIGPKDGTGYGAPTQR